MRIIILFLIITVHSVQAQNYTVIHVIGKIYDSQTSSYLKSGSKLSEDSKLKFETPNARAAALSSSRGRYVIQQQSNHDSGSDLAYTLSAVLAPARGKMSTRAGGINNQMDFIKKFGEGPIAILGGKYTTAISGNAYPSDEATFFYASYFFKGETINKKLEVENDELVFDMETFYAVDGSAIDPQKTSSTKLYYYDSQKEISTELTDLNFSVVSENEFLNIKNSLEKTSEEEQVETIHQVISSLYGVCDKAQVLAIMQKFN